MKNFKIIVLFVFIISILISLLRIKHFFHPQLEPKRIVQDDIERFKWFENMSVYHGYSDQKVYKLLDLTKKELKELKNKAQPKQHKPLLPFPGGHHPRLGYFEGAVKPKRETKVSIFSPFDHSKYLVLDIPESIHVNDEFIFLAHKDKSLHLHDQKKEWNMNEYGELSIMKRIGDIASYSVTVNSIKENVVEFELKLTNLSNIKWREIRIQNCLMVSQFLDYMPEFKNKMKFNRISYLLKKMMNPTYDPQLPYFSHGDYGVLKLQHQKNNYKLLYKVTPSGYIWSEPRVPCVHADFYFERCDPKETVKGKGKIFFTSL